MSSSESCRLRSNSAVAIKQPPKPVLSPSFVLSSEKSLILMKEIPTAEKKVLPLMLTEKVLRANKVMTMGKALPLIVMEKVLGFFVHKFLL